VRRRAEHLYQQLDMLQHLRQQARRELLAESRQHAITAKLRQIPSLGPIRSALAVALIRTPHRFRSRRQLWAYSGLAWETRSSGEYRCVEGQIRRSKKQISIRGLNKDHNHDLKRSIPRRRHQGECTARTVSGFLPEIIGQRH
jgi:transposase